MASSTLGLARVAVLTACMAAAGARQAPPAKVWTCDEITPSMCDDLAISRGSVSVRGLDVAFWLYSPPKWRFPGRPMTPLVTIHGGPAYTHNYLLPLKQQACRGRRVLFYDQAGCGVSRNGITNATAQAPWLLTIDYYLEELEAVIQAAGLGGRSVHLLGNSWGGLLAMRYALSAEGRTRLAALIVSGGLSDSQFYIESQRAVLQSTLPPFLQRFIASVQKSGEFDNPQYEDLTKQLAGMWTSRLTPNPKCMLDSVSGANMQIYKLMQGPDEFSIGGVLADVNFTGELHRIESPTLFTHGKFDTMTAPQQMAMARHVHGSRVIEYPSSGHLTMVDDAGLMNDDVAAFLAEHDQC